MVYLGVDPGYRNMGLCLLDTTGPKVIKRTTLHNGPIRAWQSGFPFLLDGIGKFIGTNIPDAAAVEMISWYGKRRGSLQLAHLAGGSVGYLLALGIRPVRFFSPKEVKSMSETNPSPKGFDEHQSDALSLCRLLALKS